nr:dyslexia-associated protein KIAA0319 homolog [Cherax quadricarinatus]
MIVSYHGEMVTAPLGYKLPDQTGPTLQLTDLIPGSYRIMLRVKDKEGLEGNETTVVNVIKETDYPPTANAGGDQIVYLPQVPSDLPPRLVPTNQLYVKMDASRTLENYR